MDYIDEILFRRREKVKKLVQENKSGKKMAEVLKIPFDRLQKYKEIIKEDLNHFSEEDEIYTNFEEFKFRTSEQLVHTVTYRDMKPARFLNLDENCNLITQKIKNVSKSMMKSSKPSRSEVEPVKPLSINEQLFIQHYLVTRNASESAKRAGLQGPNAGGQLLRRPHIQEAITMQLGEGLAYAGITVESVINDLMVLRDRGMQAHPVIDQDGAFLGEWKYDPATSMKALELMGKYLKMFTDRVEHTGPNGGPIKHVVEKHDFKNLTIEEIQIFKRLRERIITIEVPAKIV